MPLLLGVGVLLIVSLMAPWDVWVPLLSVVVVLPPVVVLLGVVVVVPVIFQALSLGMILL